MLWLTESTTHLHAAAQSFPTPMEEPKKVLKAQYLGASEVSQPTGIDVLNGAIDAALSANQPDQWEHVNVAVAPSMISIYSLGVRTRLTQFTQFQYLIFIYILFMSMSRQTADWLPSVVFAISASWASGRTWRTVRSLCTRPMTNSFATNSHANRPAVLCARPSRLHARWAKW